MINLLYAALGSGPRARVFVHRRHGFQVAVHRFPGGTGMLAEVSLPAVIEGFLGVIAGDRGRRRSVSPAG